MIKPNLILGTAQFGLDYGVTNKNGKINLNESKDILNFCKENNICSLDTAQSYGDSEKIIGHILTKNYPFQIFSKTKKINNKTIQKIDIQTLEYDFKTSCKNLNSDKIHGLLVHSIEDLKKENSNLIYEWLLSLKKRNLVNEIGISIYNPVDLEDINLKEIDVVQLPFNLYNQEFSLSKSVKKIKNNNCKIQIRSIYLQGLLLSSYLDWPSWIEQKHKIRHRELEKYCDKKNYSLLDLNLAFIKSFEFIDDLIIGVSSLKEVTNFISSWYKNIDLKHFDKTSWHSDDQNFNDPRKWPNK